MASTQHEKVLAKLLVHMSDADKSVKLAAVTATQSFQSVTNADLKRLANKNLIRSLEAGVNLKDIEFRIAVAGALGAMGDPASNTTLKVLLEDKNLKVATAAVNACVEMRQKPLLEALMEQQRDCEKTMKASNTSFKAGKKPVSGKKDPNAPADPEEVKAERAAMLVTLIPEAVKKLTGQELKTGAEMESWWNKNKSSFSFAEK